MHDELRIVNVRAVLNHRAETPPVTCRKLVGAQSGVAPLAPLGRFGSRRQTLYRRSAHPAANMGRRAFAERQNLTPKGNVPAYNKLPVPAMHH